MIEVTDLASGLTLKKVIIGLVPTFQLQTVVTVYQRTMLNTLQTRFCLSIQIVSDA